MTPSSQLRASARLAFICASLCFLACEATAGTMQILYTFVGNGSGSTPEGALVLDRQGNLYGIAAHGGPRNGPMVYELSPAAGETWTETVLHSFGGQTSGDLPFPSLTIDAAGVLYGTVTHNPGGSGEVYSLTPPSTPGGAWTYQTLTHFGGTGKADGGLPAGSLLLDHQATLYGVTYVGGDERGAKPCDCGLVYSLTRTGPSGPWTRQILSVFHAPPDGDFPYAGLTIGANGALFGTTTQGGTGPCRDGSNVTVIGCGTLYSLRSHAAGWRRKTLYSFDRQPPSEPTDALTLGPDGALYGFSTLAAYRFAPPGAPGAGWVPSVIHTFAGGFAGTSPVGAPVFDKAGNMFGLTRSFGGGGPVTLFKLEPPASNPNGAWTHATLLKLSGSGFTDQPAGGLARGPDGTLYGAFGPGPDDADGYVFALKP